MMPHRTESKIWETNYSSCCFWTKTIMYISSPSSASHLNFPDALLVSHLVWVICLVVWQTSQPQRAWGYSPLAFSCFWLFYLLVDIKVLRSGPVSCWFCTYFSLLPLYFNSLGPSLTQASHLAMNMNMPWALKQEATMASWKSQFYLNRALLCPVADVSSVPILQPCYRPVFEPRTFILSYSPTHLLFYFFDIDLLSH